MQNIRLTKNFELVEFNCKDGTPVPYEYYGNILELAKNLQVMRNFFKSPIMISSGYRTAKWNRKVGGAKHSQHKLGKAADFVVAGYKPNEVAAAIEEWILQGKVKQGGIGRYATFTHYDIRGTKARWSVAAQKVG